MSFCFPTKKSRQRGFVSFGIALIIVPVLGLVGIVGDFGRWFVIRDRLQRAVDMAALTAARTMDDTQQTAQVTGLIQTVLPEGNLGARNTTVQITTESQAVIVTATTHVSPTLLAVFGMGETTLRQSATAHYEPARGGHTWLTK